MSEGGKEGREGETTSVCIPVGMYITLWPCQQPNHKLVHSVIAGVRRVVLHSAYDRWGSHTVTP